MKNIAEFSIGCFLLLVVLGGSVLTLLGVMVRSPAGFIALLGITGLVLCLCVFLAGLVAFWLWSWVKRVKVEQQRKAEFVNPDEHGRLPIPVSALRSETGIAAAFDLNKASFFTNMSHYHNSPTINGADSAVTRVEDNLVPSPFGQLYQAGKLPGQGFLMGYEVSTNDPVIVSWSDLASSLVGGLSQTGKSTLVRSLLAQAALQGSKFVVIDRHYGAGEKSLGASLAPLRDRVMCIAHDDKTIVDAFKLVETIGKARLSGDTDRTPIVLVVDEVTALLLRDDLKDPLINVLGIIAQETSKVAVYAICIGQNFHGKVMDTIVRNSFVSYISTRARKSVAQTMTEDSEFAKLAAGLTIGQAVWMTPGGNLHMLQVPNCTAADLEIVAGCGFRVLDTSTSGKDDFQMVSKVLPDGFQSLEKDITESPLETTWKSSGNHDPRSQRVRQLLKEGKSVGEIVGEIWQVKSGRPYQDASKELMQIVASLI